MNTEEKIEVIPVVGMGVTICFHSDSHPATVTQVLSKSRIVIQEDNAKRIDDNGMSECQVYEYTPDLTAPKLLVRKTTKGWKTEHGQYLSLGVRRKYYDYSF